MAKEKVPGTRFSHWSGLKAYSLYVESLASDKSEVDGTFYNAIKGNEDEVTIWLGF